MARHGVAGDRTGSPRSSVFAGTGRLRIAAVIASSNGFPAARGRSRNTSMPRSHRMAAVAAICRASRAAIRPPRIILRPRRPPEPRFIGATPARAATHAASADPGSLISAGRVTAATAPIPGIEVRTSNRRRVAGSARTRSRSVASSASIRSRRSASGSAICRLTISTAVSESCGSNVPRLSGSRRLATATSPIRAVTSGGGSSGTSWTPPARSVPHRGPTRIPHGPGSIGPAPARSLPCRARPAETSRGRRAPRRERWLGEPEAARAGAGRAARPDRGRLYPRPAAG